MENSLRRLHIVFLLFTNNYMLYSSFTPLVKPDEIAALIFSPRPLGYVCIIIFNFIFNYI